MKPAILFSISVLVTAAASAQTAAPPVHKPGDGVSAPTVVTDRKPIYPSEAMTWGVDGVVMLECVVETNGSVGEVRVFRSLDPALDEAAVTALKAWRFKPAMKDGQPVRALVNVEMSFSLAQNEPRVDSPDVFKPGPGVTLPTVLKEVKPGYTAKMKEAGIQGIVRLDCVVQPDGRVGDARVTKSLDPGLDREAVRALKQWRFKPGERLGKAVPVQVSVEITFTLE
jgi:TonB family protein